MKRVRCPKCDNFITFDEKKYHEGQSLIFLCPQCGKEFAIRIGVSKLRKTQKEENEYNANNPTSLSNANNTVSDSHAEGVKEDNMPDVGSIVVIENVFHYKQVLPLHMGDNSIGRYMKGNPKCDTPIETNDPSIDMNHCVINVSRNKNGKLKYILRDGPSYTGTFVDNQILGDRERRVIEDGTLFTIGATSIILKSQQEA